jgi:excisionase family DNA binding protein
MNTLTTEQAAARLGITPTRVRVLIRSGRLPAARFGRAHVINEEDLRFVANRKRGRPPQQASNEHMATASTQQTNGRARHSAGTTRKLNQAFRKATESDQSETNKRAAGHTNTSIQGRKGSKR